MTGIAARLTPAGRGAVAVIGLYGDALPITTALATFFSTNSATPWHERPPRQLIYGRWGSQPAEDVVLCRTDNNRWEIQCHGGDAAVRRILNDLAEGDIQTTTSEEFGQRSENLLDREFQEALQQAPTWRTADLINEQAQGLFRDTLRALIKTVEDTNGRQPAEQQLRSLLKWKGLAEHLTRPWSVVLVGRPNVGKSSLMNALLGYQRSIVTEIAGTTRDVVCSVTGMEGWPVQLSDTAGLRTTEDELESAGIKRGTVTTTQADLRLLLIDVSAPPQATDWELLQQYPDDLIVAHKCDLENAWGAQLPRGAIPVSSLTAAGLEQLMQAIITRLIPEVPCVGTAMPVTVRQMTTLEYALRELCDDRPRNCRDALQALLGNEMSANDADLSSVNTVG